MTYRGWDYDVRAYFDGGHPDIDGVGMAVDGLNLDMPANDMPDSDMPASDTVAVGSVFAGFEPYDFDGSDFDRSNVGFDPNWQSDSVHRDIEGRLQRDRRRERLMAFQISARTAQLFRHATRS